MTGTDTTTGTGSRITENTFHLELCEGRILTRDDIDMISIWTNSLIDEIQRLEKKLK